MTISNSDQFDVNHAAPPAGQCYHCSLPVPAALDLRVDIDGSSRQMCCHGCQAVATAIVDAGREDFYRLRTEVSPTAKEVLPEFLRETRVYDLPEVQGQFVHSTDGGEREASLMLEGITCAACVWLIEQYIAALPGVSQVRVNYATQRALVLWDDNRLKLSEILQAVRKIGYQALPYNPQQQQESHRQQRRQQLRRLAVAGLFGMQVMMLSISLYAGAWSGMEMNFQQLFRWLSLALTLPVMLYSSTPFFTSAWRDLKRGRVAMDFPVSLAIGIAFVSSTLATVRGHGEIYFDSVVMFIFFLSASRYFENMARQRSGASVEQLVQSLPNMATRLTGAGEVEETVPAASLAIGDRVLIRSGDAVPADGMIVEGGSAIDESLLSGESAPLDKQPGDQLVGGSINVTNPLQMEVQAIGAETVMAEIQRSIEHAQADKPPLARLADRVAAGFISVVLVIVSAVALFWWVADAERWFEIALSVLIVSCPCALSLATPTALSAALGKMQSVGLLVKRGSALERLAQVTHVVFDKTGTLTRGKPRLQQVICADGFERGQCLQLAAILQQHSSHPLARSLLQEVGGADSSAGKGVSSVAGGGIHGFIDGQEYHIGSVEFVTRETELQVPRRWLQQIDNEAVTAVVLARGMTAVAMFTFVDELRDDAEVLVAGLKGMGKKVILMTGDRTASAQQVAGAVGIDDCRAKLSPQGKMEAVQALQATGAKVLMVGDGVNDAPVLANADISIAMGGASALAKTSADIVLVANRLQAVTRAFDMAVRTRRVIRQNMTWALMYNFGAIPAAASGLVAPWVAALGMSLSSLIVVLNALRLTR